SGDGGGLRRAVVLAGDDVGDGDVGNFDISDGADFLAGIAAAQAVGDEQVNRVGGVLDRDVAIIHTVNDATVVAGDADARFHGLADPDVPEVDVAEIPGGFGSELQAVAAGLEVTIPDVNV